MSQDISLRGRFLQVAETTPDTVLLHADGTLVFANPAAVKLLGAESASDLVGRSMSDFALSDSQAIVRNPAPGSSQEETRLVEEEMRRLDGTVINVEVVCLASSFEGRDATHLVIRDITARKNVEAALRQSEKRYRDLFEGVPVGVFQISPRGELVLFNKALIQILGAPSRESLLGFDTGTLYVDPADRDAWKTMVQYEGRVTDFETEIWRFDRSKVWVRTQAQVIRNERGEIAAYEGVFEDITDRKRAEDALRSSEERFRSLVQNASDMISILDADARVLYYSPASLRLLGFSPGDGVGDAGFEAVHPHDRPRVQSLFDELIRNPRESQSAEYRMRHSDGSWRVLESKITNLLDNTAVSGVVINSRDISDRKRAEDQLLHDAFHDALTELPNRSLFMDRLEHCLDRRARISAYRCAVLFLDLDRFKMVNDSFGHAVGDRLLVQVSRRLRSCLRPSDTLARLGGDEFAILLDEVDDPPTAVRVAQRIQQELEAPFQLEGREIYSTASIGIALSSASSRPADVLRDADTAMYRAKGQGRAGYAIFDSAMHAQVRTQLELETDLRRALSQWQFEVFYQPIVALPAGQLVGFEALVRWHHPERGLVLPGAFMPIAEETGLINPIGRGVLSEACHQMKRWNEVRAPREPIFVSVNLSPRQFLQTDLAAQLSQVLDATGLSGNRLAIEIQEGAVMQDPEAALETLVRVRRLGIRIALDDFGTGTSSLSVLQRLPFDRIKIDPWFVRSIGAEGGSGDLVEGIIALCRSRRLEIVAEGVESEEQRRRLCDMGCDFAQGFLFSEPVAKGRAAELLTAPSPDFDDS